MDSYLPKSLQAPHIAAFEQVLADRFANIDTSPCMMYMVDTCSPAALPFLADQFDIAQFRDYQLATNDNARRELIKKAINTRSYMGTVYMVKQAMIVCGFDPSLLVERCNVGSDPVHGWAQFKIGITGHYSPIDGIPGLDVSTLILQYKNARSEFLGVEFTIDPFDDSFPAGTEDLELTVSFEPFVDLFNTAGFKYDGAHKYDGSMKYRPGIEQFEITII
jgi:P2-related tail formation protein